MLMFLTLSLVLTPVAPGRLDVSPIPTGAEVFAQGQDCDVKVDGNRISGEGGCSVTIAVVAQDGTVSRMTGKLPTEQFAEDLPIPTNQPDAATRRTQTDPIAASQASPEPRQREDATKLGWSAGAAAYLSRDIGPFGFVTAGLTGIATWEQRLSIKFQLERGTGRAETDLLATEDAVEESIFLALLGIAYQHPLVNGAFAYVGAMFGAGRIAADGISDDRNAVSDSVQPLTVARPSAGLGWRTGPVSLSLGWQSTFAQGQYFSADAYGDTEGTKPPDNEGLLSQGLELQLGVTF